MTPSTAKLPHSAFIARFLAKEFQLAGKDKLEQAKVEVDVDTIKDAPTVFYTSLWRKE